MKGRGNTDTKTDNDIEDNTAVGQSTAGGCPSSWAQGSAISRLLFRLNKEAWDPKALSWTE